MPPVRLESEDVRDLIEFSRYGPTSSKYKIFIIDEVHMLSKQAFNALLKTLEEPPEYKNGGALKFIFATTEIKKFLLQCFLDVKDLIYLE